MRPQIRPEILEADLSNLVLQLAVWGVADVTAMAWLDAPPPARLTVARQTLQALAALDENLRPTALGRRMAALPLAPRPARLLLWGQEHAYGALACCVAALLEERDPLARASGTANGAVSAQSDMGLRLDWLCRENGGYSGESMQRLRRQARRLAALLHLEGDIFKAASQKREALGALLALAWPEHVAMRQTRENGDSLPAPGGAPMVQYLLRSGRAAWLAAADALARQPFLAVADLDGAGSRGRIRLAAPLERPSLEMLFGAHISNEDQVTVTDEGQIQARRRTMLDALILDDRPLPRPTAEQCAQALRAFVRQRGLACLPWNDEARQWQARVGLLRALEGEPWPDLGDAALLESLEQWLAPALTGCTSLRELTPQRLLDALRNLLPRQLFRQLNEKAPTHWQLPSGALRPIVYGHEGGPWLAAKLQELFGCQDTPRIAAGRVPLTLRLNSPAGRPLQVTRDLAHFWRNGYQRVRAEMRGRYPRHPWPEDPLQATATALTKKKLAARS